MKKHICPHCGQPGISITKKALMGPSSRRECSECGKMVSVKALPFYLVILPIFAITIASGFSGYSIYMTLALILGPIIALLIHNRFVPLVKK